MKNLKAFITTIALTIFFGTFQSFGQKDSTTTIAIEKKPAAWYENINIRGYLQTRYNNLLQTNEDLGCEQCDKSWGGNGGFFIRRGRLILFGQINPRVYFYIQPDFASSVSSTSLHFIQLRDAYMDLGIDKKNVFRFRIGQSKVPFGFENMQSSQNRLSLDRNDPLNSAVTNERDLGVFFYWTPEKIQNRLNEVTKSGLKGSGNYGAFAFGIYNGQTANKPELNNEPHVVSRFTWPFAIKKQIIETSIQAYHGYYVIPSSSLSPGVRYKENRNYLDQRVAASIIVYPKPFGFQAEYNVGRGPEFNKWTDSIEVQNLRGGYAMLNYKLEFGKQLLYPFVKYQYYNGGKKHELDARSYRVNDLEFGLEWSPLKQFELVVMYVMSARRYEDYSNQSNFQRGNLLRIQAQLNF